MECSFKVKKSGVGANAKRVSNADEDVNAKVVLMVIKGVGPKVDEAGKDPKGDENDRRGTYSGLDAKSLT